MKKLSIIIVTYNSEDLILSCLDSIYKYNDIGDYLEIIIVDNSFDSESMFAKIKINYPKDIKLISNTSNDGYGRGNNIGAAAAESPYFLILNPDVRLNHPIFSYAISFFDKNRDVCIIGPKEFNEHQKKVTSFYYRMEYSNLIRRVLLQKLLNHFDYFIQEKMYINGACFFISKACFLMVKGFDENIFLYAEEPDLISRIEQNCNNNKCAYLPQLHIIHLEKRVIQSYHTLKITADSAIYYLNKNNYSIETYLKRRIFYCKLKKYYAYLKGNKLEVGILNKFIEYLCYKLASI